jgi:hypothetical protein
LNLLTFFSRIHITPSWRRDTVTILRPIQISIQICGWRHEYLVDLIEIGCAVSLTLRLRTYGRPAVFQPLDAYIGFKHSNSGVRGNFKPMSSSSDNPSCYWLRTTQCWNGRNLLIDNGDEISDEWYMCSLLFAPQSRQRPASSSSAPLF